MSVNTLAMRDSNPHVAYSAREIAHDAIAACRRVRSLFIPSCAIRNSGEWSHEVAYYAEAFRRIREQCGAHPTLPPLRDARKRYAHFVETANDAPAKPDLGALDMGSLNYLSWDAGTRRLGGGVYENSIEHLRDALAALKECGIKRSTLRVFDGAFCALSCFSSTREFDRTADDQVLLRRTATASKERSSHRADSATSKYLPNL